ncbi:MAG: FAD-binding domain-containing protein [Myxococcota bacterium]
MSELGLVWFKRDLRITDHQPLVEASRRGPCLALYIYEPEICAGEDYDAGHLRFVNEALVELRAALGALGATLLCRVGDAERVLADLQRESGFSALYSHEETGNALTYARDLRVASWARSAGVAWHEYRQFGVVRGLKDRDGWAKRWNTMMAEPLTAAPAALKSVAIADPGAIMSPAELGLAPRLRDEAQVGGALEAQATLASFLTERGAEYQSAMSSPNSAWTACSRLSPHLAYGTISMRTVHQALRAQRQAVKEARAAKAPFPGSWGKSLASFDKRLHWHCHFMQKLESEPNIEHRNMASSHDGLRENDFDAARFEAWCQGKTGYPMVDACMRAVSATGWLNFRMRAMVVSFASYHLWLHWRPTALFLARAFIDYEPGIHFSQVQMQSGTTGINAVRIYSPIKQVSDQDPEGHFIKRWVPELAGVPNENLAQPHLMSRDAQQRAGIWIGETYPEPLVEHLPAVREAQSRIRTLRRTPEARAEADAINTKHGSRRRPDRRGPRGRKTGATKAEA